MIDASFQLSCDSLQSALGGLHAGIFQKITFKISVWIRSIRVLFLLPLQFYFKVFKQFLKAV
jgi:hypothetical protein